MAANNNYLNVENNFDRLTAFFSNKSEAYRAMTELKQAGFSSNQIGLAALNEDVSAPSELSGTNTRTDYVRSEDPAESGEHHSFWQEVKDFFSGESHSSESHDESTTDFDSSTSGLNWSKDRSSYYSRGLQHGGAVVTVTGGNNAEARRILEQCGGDLRDSDFEPYSNASASEAGSRSTAPDNVVDIGQRSIQLRGELLRAHKERVQSGEVRLRKEVVTENQTIEVPVTREELVIERTKPTSASASGEIGSDSEIRIPLSEERVTAEKQAVVNEEVRVGKREFTDTEHVSDTVRHEELKVEGDDNVADIDGKNRAA